MQSGPSCPKSKRRSPKNPDYQETVARLQPNRPTPISALQYHHLLLNTPNPEACAYHLAKHPEMLARMWALESSGRPLDVMRELNDLSAGLRFAGNAATTGAGSAARRERAANSAPP